MLKMDKKELLIRLNRAKGQLEGIERMINESRGCLDTVQQIAAVRSALAKIGVALLKDEVKVCSMDSTKNLDKIIEELFRLN